MPVDESCTYRGGLLRPACGREAVAVCVYCGAPFCAAHGERHADYADVCARRRCRSKYADVGAHRESVDQRRQKNRVSVCAHEGCEERMRHRCSRCLLEFCNEHVKERDVSDPLSATRRKARALVCDHCHERRKLWG